MSMPIIKLIITTFVAAGLVNGVQWYFYVTSREAMMAYFNTDSTGITWTATINSVMCGVAIIPVVVFMDTFKLRVIMLTATVTMGEFKCSGFIITVTT